MPTKLTVEDLKKIKQEYESITTLREGGYRAKVTVHMGTCGIAAGAEKVMSALMNEVREKNVKDIIITTSGCAGLCSREPMATVELIKKVPVKYGNLDEKKIIKILNDHILEGKIVKEYAIAMGSEFRGKNIPLEGYALKDRDEDKDMMYTFAGEKKPVPLIEDIPFFNLQVLWALRNRGVIDAEKIEEYIAQDGYLAAGKALFEMTPEEIIQTVKDSGLRGRGGAGFPTGLKWEFCYNAKGDEKFVLCNGDEGDPGAFMDRSILESDPHAVLEGMIIAAKAIGAHKGYIYVRAEYPLAVKRLEIAIKQAKEYGLLGEDILGSGFDFDIEIYQGAGAFVCGEETALMTSIEGRRGMPRPRPPFPAHKGLWQKPSLLNNVETFANIPQIILNGAQWYRSLGTEKSPGTKVFALTGVVNNIGLIEVPMGIPLRKIIYDIGGGIQNNRKFKAVQIGGPSGGCIPESLIDTPVDFESITTTGAIMGSGGLVVMDETTCMVAIAKFFLEFTQEESCGKCVPCRIGTKLMLDKLEDICAGKGQEGDIELLENLAEDIKNISLCGLGQTAPNPVLTTIKYFRDEYEAHIKEKYCPSHSCLALLKFEVIPDLCKKCGLCAKECPVEAIVWEKKQVAVIDKEKCIRCKTCIAVCRFMAIE